MVTLASLLLVGAAFYWFAAGQYAIGLVAAWLMTFLDTVDGKLARVTVTHTKFGNVFDHGIDLVHPPFWYWAWMIGLQATGMKSEEHTSELQSLMRISYAVFCLNKKKLDTPKESYRHAHITHNCIRTAARAE